MACHVNVITGHYTIKHYHLIKRNLYYLFPYEYIYFPLLTLRPDCPIVKIFLTMIFLSCIPARQNGVEMFYIKIQFWIQQVWRVRNVWSGKWVQCDCITDIDDSSYTISIRLIRQCGNYFKLPNDPLYCSVTGKPKTCAKK